MSYSIASPRNHFQHMDLGGIAVHIDPEEKDGTSTDSHIVFDEDGWVHSPVFISQPRRHGVRATARYNMAPGMYLLRKDSNNIAKFFKVIEAGLLLRIDHDVELINKLATRVDERYGSKQILAGGLNGRGYSGFGGFGYGYGPWSGGSGVKKTMAHFTGLIGITDPGVSGSLKWADGNRESITINFNPTTINQIAWQKTIDPLSVFVVALERLEALLPYVAPGTHIQLVTKDEDGKWVYGEPEEITPKSKIVKNISTILAEGVRGVSSAPVAVNLIAVSKQWLDGEQSSVVEVICFTDVKGAFLTECVNVLNAADYPKAVGYGGVLNEIIQELKDPYATKQYVKFSNRYINLIVEQDEGFQGNLGSTTMFQYGYVNELVQKQMKFEEKRYQDGDGGFDMPVIDKKMQVKYQQLAEKMDSIMHTPCAQVYILQDQRIPIKSNEPPRKSPELSAESKAAVADTLKATEPA